ncbi:RNA-directed DNA polymerase, eukaryota [Tanacetum coccineum]
MGDDDWNEVTRKNRGYKTKEDDLAKVSMSIYVTNFPESCSAKDLFQSCKVYGHAVDSYIPLKRSKSGKRFGFVRFINVFSVERLISNLCTIWIGKFRLHANITRFQRPSVNTNASVPFGGNGKAPQFMFITPRAILPPSNSFVSAVKGSSTPLLAATLPAIVLDEECLVDRDLDNSVMGEVLHFSSLNNLRVLLYNEGFADVEIMYLGGLWVMIKLGSYKSKLNFMKHLGVASWFAKLCNAQNDFVANERIVWVDIEGVPLNAWSRKSFHKIGLKWGEVMDVEDSTDDMFARKRLCIKTNLVHNILDSFKIIVKGKVFMVRAKELFVWSPSFKDVPEVIHAVNDIEDIPDANVEEESNCEAVSDTCFGDSEEVPVKEKENIQSVNDKEVSKDPFGIYEILNRSKVGVNPESSIPYPPGFTPEEGNETTMFVNISQEVQEEHHKSASCSSRVFEEVENSDIYVQSEGKEGRPVRKEGGSILDALDDMIKGLGSKAKKDWIRELTNKHKISFLSLQETKKEFFTDLEIKYFWGNYQFAHVESEALGLSGGILCVWDSNIFQKHHHIISDNFVALYGMWIPKKIQILIISIYAPQPFAAKRQLWDYIASLISQWRGDCIVLGDFNEVRCKEERWGSTFHAQGARLFNSFISNTGLNEVQLEGFSFTWAHPSASKMSKLDRFLVSDGIFTSFPHISAVCLDRHLSDHRPIILREKLTDFGATPFCFYHSWLSIPGFDQLVNSSRNSFNFDDSNGMIRFKKKLQCLKKEIRKWVADFKSVQSSCIKDIKKKLCDIDKVLDQGGVTDDVLLSRMETMKQLHDLNSSNNIDFVQKAKVRWAIEGDENTKFFHGVINRKRANLSVKGIMIDGVWVDDPSCVKEEFRYHFEERFNDPGTRRGSINFRFPNRLSIDQIPDLESAVSDKEIRKALGIFKWFFDHGTFATGCNSSFVTLIPKSLDPKLVSEFRPISLIGSLYKVITKILATRLSFVISDLISNVQTAFLPNRQILDGPFILNEILARCKHKHQQAMFLKVDFAKAYDSVRWDYLDDVLNAFGFGTLWRSWIQGSLNSGKASILVNGSPTSEFQFHRGLKQGDPLAPFLFILIMESLHLSLNRAIDVGVFSGLRMDDDLTISHLFYADDVIFMGDSYG